MLSSFFVLLLVWAKRWMFGEKAIPDRALMAHFKISRDRSDLPWTRRQVYEKNYKHTTLESTRWKRTSLVPMHPVTKVLCQNRWLQGWKASKTQRPATRCSWWKIIVWRRKRTPEQRLQREIEKAWETVCARSKDGWIPWSTHWLSETWCWKISKSNKQGSPTTVRRCGR